MPLQNGPRPEAEVILEHAGRPPYLPEANINGSPAVLVPGGWSLQTPPGWEPVRPTRTVTRPEFHTVESFSRYVMDFKTPATQIFAAFKPAGRFTAVIDYHTADKAAWCAHMASYMPVPSEAFARWTQVNGKPMTQGNFALFLENNLRHVTEPAGADLLQIINQFEVDGILAFSKGQKLQDGSVSFQFQNTTTAKSGQVAVPTHFELTMPMFDGEEVMQFSARLRYRLTQGGELTLWFEIAGMEDARNASLESILKRIATGTAITPLRGTIAAP